MAGAGVGVAGGVVAAGSRLLCAGADAARCCSRVANLGWAFGVVSLARDVVCGPVGDWVRGIGVRRKDTAGGGCESLRKFLRQKVGCNVWCTEEWVKEE